jgi:hypothetical protein
MLTVTRGAGVRLLRKLARKGATDEIAMRVTRKTRGWKLRLDHARPADTAITHEGRIVLLLDEEVSQAMADMTLDVSSTQAGPRLTLR